MPIEIDPNTGAPVVKAATTDFTPKDESLHSSPNGTSDEGTNGTDSTDEKNEEKEELLNTAKELREDSKYPKSRAEFVKAVDDIVQRYTSDSQARQKCMAEIEALISE